MTSFLLKIVACITMFIDHIGYLVHNGMMSIYNFIGRFAFPIFAFQISEGYTHTKNLKKYIFRIFIFALISQYPFMLFHSLISTKFALNVFFTLLLGLTCIIIYDKNPLKVVSLIIIICIGYIAEITNCDYGFYGVAVIFLFYLFKNNKLLINLSFILCTIIKYTMYIYKYGNIIIYLALCFCTLLSLVFINLYNKKQGKKLKYFLYIFYPVHLLIICILWNIIYT